MIKLVLLEVSAKMALEIVNRMAPTKNITRQEIFNRSVIAGSVSRDARSNVAILGKKSKFRYQDQLLKEKENSDHT